MSEHEERMKVIQANEIANLVFEEVKRVWPDLHPVLDLRYGIADAIWDAGYRKAVTHVDTSKWEHQSQKVNRKVIN